LALPQGGGAPRGLDATVQTSQFCGAAQVSIPLDIPLPRNGGLAPQLALAYGSSTNNGPCGAGAAISLPTISRATARGVPTYTDADTLTFSETGPLLEKGDWQAGRWIPAERTVTDPAGATWRVRQYLPRLQTSFPLVERWTPTDSRISHWRVVNANNVESLFGVSPEARIADPADPSRIFSWLIEESSDAKGNRVLYRYKSEDETGVPPRPGTSANRYIERVLYGNYVLADAETFAFEIVFDYGEYDLDHLDVPGADPFIPTQPWPARPDCFSSYRPGFDLRTNRLCRAILTFNRFPAELGREPCLTSAARLDYTLSPYLSCLSTVTRVGFQRGPDRVYAAQALPPVSLEFISFDPSPAPEFRKLHVDRQANLPGYLAPGAYLPVDLDGEGIPGFLQSNGAFTYYYAPLGEGRYAAALTPEVFPDFRDLTDSRLTLTDIDGDGHLEMLLTSETQSGFFRRGDGGRWGGFEPIARIPTTEQSSASETVDLHGDGRADLMTLSRSAVNFYPSLGEKGFAPARSAGRRTDFPSAQANSGTERVVFADVFGDGLAHRLRVTDGEVAVWPNLGEGRFGDRLTLANPPASEGFAASRCFFADIDGTGAIDIVIAASDRLLIYRNQAGNGFSAPLAVPLPFRLGDNDQLSFVDILGNGTTAIVATRTAPAVEHWFCDLASPAGETGHKPYLLSALANGCGATTQITYRSSAAFYLEDKRQGRRWPTRLPFPVQVVETLSVHDAVTGAKTRQRFRYHDGYYDGLERTFRGFAYVECWNEQDYAPFLPAPDWPVARINADLKATSGYSRSWYATGAYFEAPALQSQYDRDIYRGDPAAPQLTGNVFDAALIAEGGVTLRQAYGALAGRAIRNEVYGLDDDGKPEPTPYMVTASNFEVSLVQNPGPRQPASLLAREHELLTYRYERDAADPRVEHSFLLAATILDPTAGSYYERRCTVCYPRGRGAQPVYPEQLKIKATLDEEWSTCVDMPFRMIGVSYAQRSLDLGNLTPPAGRLYTFAEIGQQAQTALASEIPYGQPFSGAAPQSRPTTHVERYFWNDDQSASLPLGQISARALLHHERNAVFSKTWRAETFGDKVSDGDLTDLAGLADGTDGYWWNPGLIQAYFKADRPDLFFLPSGSASPSQTASLFFKSTYSYDSPYALRPVEVTQYSDPATPITAKAKYDYQSLQPSQLTDANGVIRQALYLPLGLVLATSLFKPASGTDPRVGDGDLANYQVQPSTDFAAIIANPATYLQQAASFFAYDLTAWTTPASQPVASLSLTRTRFVSDNVPDAPIELGVEFADALGHTVERKRLCEPQAPGGATRWQAMGRTVYDGQGQPAQTYRAFYTADAAYEPQQALADGNLAAPPDIQVRDPLGRVVRVATSKGFFTRTVFGTWETLQYDEDDTVLDAPFYRAFMASYPSNPTLAQKDERAALLKAAAFYNTPSSQILDNAGRPFRQIQNNLGEVSPDAFASIVTPPITSEELWSALITAGYLATLEAPKGTWVTSLFQPYSPDFTLTLPAPYDHFAAAAATLLLQNDLTTRLVTDSAGRLLEATDPRLFLAEVQGGPESFSARFAYPMGSQTAARSDSGDAGGRWQLTSYVGTTVLSFDAKGRRLQQTFDGQQRPLVTTVSEGGGPTVTTQTVTYGDGRPDAAAANLIGEVWQVQDEAGVLNYPAYTILGQAAQSIRQFAADYKSAPNWSQPVALDPQTFTTTSTYDALTRLLTETLPDSSLIARSYWVSGRLAQIDVTLPGGAAQPFITAISYAADDSRTRVAFGNQTVQSSTFEATTGRVTTLLGERPATATRDPTMQQAAYAYDPVGNLSVVRDRTAQLLFCGRTEPEALCDYGYNAIYQLVSATGLQHPGIEADTYVTGFMQSLYAELCPPQGPPVTLEPYEETYSYDLSANVVALVHDAASAAFTRAYPVEAGSNRLTGTSYDANGNSLTAELAGPAPLTWNNRNLLAQTGPFARPDGTYDHDYKVYDISGLCTRHVTEHSPNATSPPDTVTDRLFLGAYVQERVSSGGQTTVRSSLRISEKTAWLAVADTLSSGAREARFQFQDRLGSISVETGADAGILSYEAFYPYGGTAIIAGNDPAVVARKAFRYSGKPADEDTGFYDYGARHYLPWQSRWPSADPAGSADGLNLFRFVRGNPATIADPDGRWPPDDDDIDNWNGRGMTTENWRAILNAFPKGAIYSAITSPYTGLVLGPTNIIRNFTDNKEVSYYKKLLRSEARMIGYNVALKGGADPSWEVMKLIEPERIPRSMQKIPTIDKSLFRYTLDYILDDPATYGDFFGAYLGNSATVGVALTMARRFLYPASVFLGPQWRIAGALGFVLTRAGRREEKERYYKSSPELMNPIVGETGIPINAIYQYKKAQERQAWWEKRENYEIALGLIAMAAFYFGGGTVAMKAGQKWGPNRSGGSKALVLHPSERTKQAFMQAMRGRPVWAFGLTKKEFEEASLLLKLYRQKNSQLVPVKSSLLVVYKKPVTDIVVRKTPPSQMQRYRQPTPQPQYKPTYRPSQYNRGFTPEQMRQAASGNFTRTLIRNPFVAVGGGVVTIGATALFYNQKNRNSKTGTDG
jgi:RHS repeat-associated protein